MTGHVPRLVQGDHAYCGVCQRALCRFGRVWRAVWSGSGACTGAPPGWGKPSVSPPNLRHLAHSYILRVERRDR